MPELKRERHSAGWLAQTRRIKDNLAELGGWEFMTLDDLDEVFEDRDPFEFL